MPLKTAPSHFPRTSTTDRVDPWQAWCRTPSDYTAVTGHITHAQSFYAARMRTPSWVELAGRNAAAESLYVTGTLEVSQAPPEKVRVDFHHAPGGKWRVEHDGQPVYLSTGTTAVVRVDDQMEQLDGDIQLPILGAQFSPLDLLGRGSLLNTMSAGMVAGGAASRIEVEGRDAWSVRLFTPKGEAILLAFDDATGLLVRVTNAEGAVLLHVNNLAELDSLPDSVFVWDGPVHQARSPRGRRPSARDDEDERIEFMRAVVAAQARPQDVLSAIAAADSENSARAALVALLGVTDVGADSIMSTPIGQFRGDHTTANRRNLEIMEERHRR